MTEIPVKFSCNSINILHAKLHLFGEHFHQVMNLKFANFMMTVWKTIAYKIRLEVDDNEKVIFNCKENFSKYFFTVKCSADILFKFSL